LVGRMKERPKTRTKGSRLMVAAVTLRLAYFERGKEPLPAQHAKRRGFVTNIIGHEAGGA